MLNPDSRTLFLDALRPPEGFELDVALATTYSLDLTAMLLAPLAFARLDGFQTPPAPGRSAAEAVDPFALLKSLRTYAERTTVFCQSGRISVPRSYHRLHAYLEQSVVQVTPHTGLGVFHPKVWALRFTHPEGDVRYRVLCLSRNLTFDNSWDTALTLDGELAQDRSRGFSDNRKLSEFFAALPSLAVGSLPAGVDKRVELVAEELRRVRFDLPEDFELYDFAPIGIAGYTGVPFGDDRCDARLVVSPFVTDGGLKQLPGSGGTLVSRLEELDQLSPETLEAFDEVFVLTDSADQLEGDEEVTEHVSTEWAPPPTGLHAKLYVVDEGWDAWVWTGSANATTAAFSDNVEFLVALRGKKSRVGVQAMLAEHKGVVSFRSILQTYTGAGKVESPLTDEDRLEQELRRVRAALARRTWQAAAKGLPDGRFEVSLACDAALELPAGAELRVTPISLKADYSMLVPAGGEPPRLTFPPCSFDALTSFFSFELTLSLNSASVKEDFVVHAPLAGAPENRLARVLDSMLSNPEAVLRFLRLLLATSAFDVLHALGEGAPVAEGVGRASGRAEPPLLESMLRALAEEPGKLDAIAQVVDDLSRTEGGLARLPPGFLEAWKPIREARESLGGRRRE